MCYIMRSLLWIDHFQKTFSREFQKVAVIAAFYNLFSRNFHTTFFEYSVRKNIITNNVPLENKVLPTFKVSISFAMTNTINIHNSFINRGGEFCTNCEQTSFYYQTMKYRLFPHPELKNSTQHSSNDLDPCRSE